MRNLLSLHLQIWLVANDVHGSDIQTLFFSDSFDDDIKNSQAERAMVSSDSTLIGE